MNSAVSTQSVIAIGSGEAEFAASVQASSTSMGIRRDMGLKLTQYLQFDSSTAIKIFNRRGIGNICCGSNGRARTRISIFARRWARASQRT